ncbi:MAG: glycosyltransferase family 2 protein [Halobacteriovoraceae bacterium]|jgi:glycosyltransferase involved in cell wall biosynthesis|nr:glycosyltransferase family 2 protein [Halobacteriovoraceae bacterium]MBT5095306.1 glycosyltransferase family 2 protein [Halobacteriovoraceae bacterium]
MKLSIIVPVFNEEATLEKCLGRVESIISKITVFKEFEIIVVDDGSSDNTKLILHNNYENKAPYLVKLSKTHIGKGQALKKGIQASTGDVVIFQDADLEYSPADYAKLLTPFFKKKAKVVYGSRFLDRETKDLHALGNKILTVFSNLLSGTKLTDMETGLKSFRGPLIREMIIQSSGFSVEPEITAKLAKVTGLKIHEVPISYSPRTHDEGKKIKWIDGAYAIGAILYYNIMARWDTSFKITLPELKAKFKKDKKKKVPKKQKPSEEQTPEGS